MKFPADSLIIPIGSSASGKSTRFSEWFGWQSLVSSDDFRELLGGDINRQDINQEVFEFFHKVIDTRLRLGLFTVADATNLTSRARNKLYAIAKDHGRPVFNILLDVSQEQLTLNNESRDRQVPTHVLDRHYNQLQQLLVELKVTDDNGTSVIKFPYKEDFSIGSNLTPTSCPPGWGWVVIGDVHGCYDELLELQDKIPPNFNIAFVGDFVDRGPYSAKVLQHVEAMILSGKAIAVKGNHDHKLYRAKVLNRNVVINDMLQATLDQVTVDDCQFIDQLPYQVHLGHPDYERVVTVTHGALSYADRGKSGIKAIQAMNLYGETDGTKTPDGFPNRTYKWTEDWNNTGNLCVIGHTPVKFTTRHGDGVLNIDTGCAFGGHLTAFDPFTGKEYQVKAHKEYSTHVYFPSLDIEVL